MKKLDLNENKKIRVKMWGRCGRDHVLSLKYLNNQILLYEKEYINIFYTLYTQNYTSYSDCSSSLDTRGFILFLMIYIKIMHI